jgi:serine/threonine-protein kinase
VTAATAEDRDRVGPYRVIQAIGAGGSARIDLARIDRAYGFQRHVVLKRPLEHLRGDPAVAASLRREARIGGRLRHPNLVAVLDAGIHDGYDYLALEYVHGAALRQVMQGDAPGQVRDLPLGVALAIVGDTARGMHEAHELTDDGGAPLGLVHRDVSPGNILLGLDGTVKLADFGIAKETRVSTLSGSMHGTVTYMAPEQCQGHAFDRRADVFSLGVILYELVTGTRLFWADNDVASLHRVLSGAVPRPRQVKPQLPGALEELVMTAVAYAPEQRFATALELAAAVEDYAAAAGEVLGSRWIARAVEAIVGPRPVPWMTAPAAELTPVPSSERSLVDLIAAAADEPVDPGFGEGDVVDPTAADAAGDASPAPALPTRAASVPAISDEAIAPGPRRRGWIAAIVAVGAIAAGAVAAVVTTRGSDAPATAAAPAPAAPATATPAAPASPAAPAGPPASDPRRADETAAAQAPIRDEPATRAGEASSAARGPERPAIATKHKRPAGHPPREPAAAARDAHRDAGSAAALPAATAAPATAPPTNVEWKPTLLLPTDGSDGRSRR